MASLVEFQKKKMFKFIMDWEGETLEHDACATFRKGSVYPIKREEDDEIIIEIGNERDQFRVPKSLGIIGTAKVIFADIREVEI